MGSRYEVEVAVAAADGLKNVNWRHGKLRPYAVFWVDPSGGAKFSTPIDEDGDTSPRWGDKLLIPFGSPIGDAVLYVDVVHAGASGDTKPLVGSARLPLRDVVDAVSGRLERKLELRRPSGRPQGTVELRVSVREPRYAAPQASSYGVPTYAPPPPPYPAAPMQCYVAPASGYPAYGGAPPLPPSGYGPPAGGAPPPPLSGYGPPAGGAPPPPPSGYGPPAGGAPPPPPSGYGPQASGGPPPPLAGYGPPGYGQQLGRGEDKKKSKFGGMGTGLAVGAVAGALGGLALKGGFDALENKIADNAAARVKDDMYDDDGDDY